MKQITINIPEGKMDFFLELFQSLGLTFSGEGKADWSDTLPQEVIDGIKESIQQLDNGKGTPHSEVIAKHRKQFPHLDI